MASLFLSRSVVHLELNVVPLSPSQKKEREKTSISSGPVPIPFRRRAFWRRCWPGLVADGDKLKWKHVDGLVECWCYGRVRDTRSPTSFRREGQMGVHLLPQP
jgi:hypothetical protein